MKLLAKLKNIAMIILVASSLSSAQTITTFNIEIVSVPQLDFSSFASLTLNDLKGAPTIFKIVIFPEEVSVVLEGFFYWTDIGKSEVELAQFTTVPFSSRTITNQQLGDNIRIADGVPNNTAIEDNLRKGKPVGKYRLVLKLYDATGTTLLAGPIEETMEFTNPAQTLSLTDPDNGEVYDQGTVIATWSSLNGVSQYKILANKRTNANQTLEDILASGNPLINNKSVGMLTTINLATILDRQWGPGDEVVVQVYGIVQGLGGNTTIYSDPVSFAIRDPNAIINQQFASQLSNFLTNLQGIGNFTTLLGNGQVNIERIEDENGVVMTPAQVQALLLQFQANPSKVISTTIVQD